MEYEIVRLDTNGNGYVVITRDDGTSFGQNVSGCKFQTRLEWDEYIIEILDQIDARDTAERTIVPPAILNFVGTRRPVVIPPRPSRP